MLFNELKKKLDKLESIERLRTRKISHSPTGVEQEVSASFDIPTSTLKMFCSNDYLGLANHPLIREALISGVKKWGGGSGASHLVSGHMAPHEKLEGLLSDMYEPMIPNNSCLSFSSGYMANIAVVTALGAEGAEIFSDQLNHASLIDGTRLARASVTKFQHRDYAQLSSLLDQSKAAIKLVVTDAVFSMDGDVADLQALLELAERFDAWVVIDDAHGYGVLGKKGLGSLEDAQICSDRFILIGTFGKAAGLSGAFVAANKIVIDYILQTGRSYIFTTASMPAISEALIESLAIIHGEEGARRRARLRELIGLFSSHFKSSLLKKPEVRWSLQKSSTAIQPILIGDDAVTMKISRGLEELGFRVPGIRPPTVPEGKSRLRVTLSAEHNEADLISFVDALFSCCQV